MAGQGIYGKTGNVFPKRMSYLHPLAAKSWEALDADTRDCVILTDMFRTLEASLNRRYPSKRKINRKAQRPGYSAHNFGLAIDVDVKQTMENLRVSKTALDALMKRYGWHCHRIDGKIGSECWHYNYLGSHFDLEPGARNTADAIESRICFTYCRWFNIWSPQPLMQRLGYSDIRHFQSAWHLKIDGIAGPVTKRTLGCVYLETRYFKNDEGESLGDYFFSKTQSS